jgi:hypothetical protein
MSLSRSLPLLLGFGLLTCQAPSTIVPAGEVRAPWPQGAGPNGNWSAVGVAPPRDFSVRRDVNVAWSTPLPETGQGGIALADKVGFVATMAPWSEELALGPEEAERFKHATEGRRVVGKHIDAHCFERATGELLWTRRIEGSVPAIYSYPFSDATSASPVTDGERVWFTNAAGRVACFDLEGELLWEREFAPTEDGPFNKQFEPFLVHDLVENERVPVLIHMEPFPGPDGNRWHYLVGLHGLTGELLWRSADGLTHYNAPTLVRRAEGFCALHARGGPHGVPERPVGVSLTRLTGVDAGRAVWRYEDPRGNHEGALQTMAANERYALWLLKQPHNALILLDLESGTEVAEIPLNEGVTWREYREDLGAHMAHTDQRLEQGAFPARYSLIATETHAFFQAYATAWGQPTVDPPYCFARVNLEQRDVEYLEVPSGFDEAGAFVWRTPQVARALNSRGEEVTGDDRSRWDGWDWVFNGSPTRVNQRLYFTLASGLVYQLACDSARFDADAFLGLGDLGPAGATWSANSVSFADGQLYHRTAANLICFERE